MDQQSRTLYVWDCSGKGRYVYRFLVGDKSRGPTCGYFYSVDAAVEAAEKKFDTYFKFSEVRLKRAPASVETPYSPGSIFVWYSDQAPTDTHPAADTVNPEGWYWQSADEPPRGPYLRRAVASQRAQEHQQLKGEGADCELVYAAPPLEISQDSSVDPVSESTGPDSRQQMPTDLESLTVRLAELETRLDKLHHASYRLLSS